VLQGRKRRACKRGVEGSKRLKDGDRQGVRGWQCGSGDERDV
jgi:hypothetical protein